MCGVRLDCSSEVVHEYRLGQDRSFGHTSPLDPMAGFEKIMKYKSRWDNLPEIGGQVRIAVEIILTG